MRQKHTPGPQFEPTQMSSWNASGLSTHWKKQLPGGSPPEMHWKKQVTSSMQLGSSKQPTI